MHHLVYGFGGSLLRIWLQEAKENLLRQVDDPTREQMIRHLRRSHQIALRARQFGHHPFGAILVAPDRETVLFEQGNVDPVNHAESVLIRTAWTNFDADYLWNCTLYTTAEPCAMCAGTLYWANIGRLVYGISEIRLLELTGNHAENPTLNLPCRSLFEQGQKPIKVWGPIPEVEAEIVQVHQEFWQTTPCKSGNAP
ncbi:nucleoside deaminase [Phormidesmis priestleyi]